MFPKLTVPSLRADIGGVVQFHRLPFIEANEPRPIHFALYTNEDGTEVSTVQVHPDADWMAFHMQVASEHFAQACELLDTTKSVQIYGTPGDALLEQMKQASLQGFPVIVKPQFAGLERLPATALSPGRTQRLLNDYMSSISLGSAGPRSKGPGVRLCPAVLRAQASRPRWRRSRR